LYPAVFPLFNSPCKVPDRIHLSRSTPMVTSVCAISGEGRHDNGCAQVTASSVKSTEEKTSGSSYSQQGAFLIATFQAALSDADLNHLRMGLCKQVVKFRSRAVIVDVTAMDVMDSFASRTLREISHMNPAARAETVIVGIQPEVAFAMVQLGLTLEGVATALDLEEGLAY